MITAAIILAEAAVIHERMNATRSQSYGAAATAAHLFFDQEGYFSQITAL